MDTALIVIDAQQSFTARPYYTENGMNAYLEAQNRLIEDAQSRGAPIVRVLHTSALPLTKPSSKAAEPDHFAIESTLVRPIDGLTVFDASLTVHKTRHSALVGTGLDVWLTEQGVRRLIVSGIRTEQCCETSTRHASDLGWNVYYALDATMTWDMHTPSGERLSAAAIRERTATVLHNRFATVGDAGQAFAAV